MARSVLYRFRSSERLLHDRELSDQYIYCSKPEDLNDPMEGLRDIVWRGDSIIWTNFFKHYLRSFQAFCLMFELVGHVKRLSPEDILVRYMLRWLLDREPLTVATYRRIEQSTALGDLIEQMADRELRYDAILHKLRHFHHDAVEIAMHGAMGSATAIGISLSSSDDQIKEVLNGLEDQGLHMKRTKLKPLTLFEHNRNMLMIDYPKLYLRRMELLLYFDWYAACFSGTSSNSSLWSHYGDQHKGACLIFENLGVEHGSVREIRYSPKPPTTYFFEEMGTLTEEELIRTWYEDEQGRRSKYAGHLDQANLDTWRRRRLENLYRGITWKSSDWMHERESRLLLVDTFNRDHEDPASRKVQYKFTDLKGIIFGIRMTDEDKISIMDIVEEKCQEHKRDDFRYYQAYYSERDGVIGKRLIAPPLPSK